MERRALAAMVEALEDRGPGRLARLEKRLAKLQEPKAPPPLPK